MKNNLIYQIIICFAFLLKVNSQENNHVIPVDITNSINDSKIECSDTICYDNWILKVNSRKSDSIESEPGINIWYKHPMLNQELILYKNGELVRSILIPGEKVKVKLKDGNFVSVNEQLTYLIGVIKGEKETVFYLESFAGCNSCESSLIIINLKGELKVFQYLDSKKKHKTEKGSYFSEMHRIGFNIQKFEKGDFRKKSLFCNDIFDLFLGL